jgi:hypothetical protein
MHPFVSTLSHYLWKLRLLFVAGIPSARIGRGQVLQRDSKESKVRFAPARDGKPIASFWSIWSQGSEIYVAARHHSGTFKLSLHRNGQWFATINNRRMRLAPAWVLPGGQWRHALEIRFLVGLGALLPAPSGRFRSSRPGYMMEVPPGDFMTVQLLIGVASTTHATPLPVTWDWPRLLQITLRDGTCAVVVAAHFPIDDRIRRELDEHRSVRIHAPSRIDPNQAHHEHVHLAVTSTNIVYVVPQGPESFVQGPPPELHGIGI